MERRQQTRQQLAFNFPVRDAVDGRLLGHLGDISPEGLLVFGPAPLEPSRTFQIIVDCPDRAQDNAPYCFHVQVRWSSAENHDGNYDSGLHVLGSQDPALRARIAELSARFAASLDSVEFPRALRP